MTLPPRIGFVGTELAPLLPNAGGLERLVTGWAEGLTDTYTTLSYSRFDDSTPATANSRRPLAELTSECDAMVINNRPEWTRELLQPTLLILHNTVEAWNLTDWSPEEHKLSKPVSLPDNVTVVTVSKFLSSHAQHYLGLATPPEVLPPFIDPAFGNGPSWQRSTGPLLFPNRLLNKKGVIETIEAMELVSDPSLRMVFLANFAPWLEPSEEHLELMDRIRSSSRCIIEPRISESVDLAARMTTSAGVTAPSTLPEGLGLVPLESLALGIPTLISGLGGLQELIPYGAITVEPSDAEAFAAAIECVVSSPPAIDAKAVRHDFSLDHSLDVLRRLLNQLTLR
jgi:glycosyltransferase involved in cell wall biosynthesis